LNNLLLGTELHRVVHSADSADTGNDDVLTLLWDLLLSTSFTISQPAAARLAWLRVWSETTSGLQTVASAPSIWIAPPWSPPVGKFTAWIRQAVIGVIHQIPFAVSNHRVVAYWPLSPVPINAMSCSIPRILLPLLALLLSSWTTALVAAPDYCVSTPAQLLNAIHQWETAGNGVDVSIGLQQGTYAIGTTVSGNFNTDGRATGLKLLGGYNAGCTTRTVNPTNTVLDGLNQPGSYLEFRMNADSVFLLEGVTLTRFNAQGFNVLDVGAMTYGDEGIYAVKYCRFLNNSGGQGLISMYGAEMKVLNNLIAKNTLTGTFHPGMVLLYYADGFDSFAIVNNNTIADNVGAPGIKVVSVNIDGVVSSDRISEMSDNIVVNNGGADFELGLFSTTSSALISGNIYNVVHYGLPLDASNLSTSPQFINSAASNYGLANGSPAINSGLFYQRYGLPAHDLFNGNRVVGSQIDRGAIESTFDNLTTALVTNTGDNGNNVAPLAGSLRAAIQAANLASGPFQIKFAISGACPRVINMTTAMLDVTGQVTIDARTQSGWSANSGYGHFDANLCVVVNGSGATPWALHVPSGASNARLTVHGMMFAGFTDAAIRLDGGSDHRISGNQFGAVPFTSANGSAVRVSGNSGRATIGGFDDPTAVNLIAGGSVAGVYLDNAAGGNVLGNNVIGFQANGIDPGSNNIGVYMFNSPANYLLYNYIAHSSTNGVTISGSGSTGNVLQYNYIGSDWTGGIPGNQGAGVAVIFAARNTAIGAPMNSDFGGNFITRNVGPGVWISPSGGTGNRVLANRFFDNHDVDIDLATAGPSANQPSNPVTGPNHLQNYPVLSQAIGSPGSSPSTAVSGTLHSTPNASYRIDFYLATACDGTAAGRGSAEVYLGWTSVNTNASGDATIAKTLVVPANPSLIRISATATSSGGDTSEIGNCLNISSGTLPNLVFANGFE
jgi:trimeric autotransporter adhesin